MATKDIVTYDPVNNIIGTLAPADSAVVSTNLTVNGSLVLGGVGKTSWPTLLSLGAEPANANIQSHVTSSGNLHNTTSAQIPYVPSGSLVSTTVQAAITELEAGKQPSIGNVIDMTNATVDAPLAVGQTFSYILNTVTSMPLHITTQGGIYELSFFAFPQGTLVTGDIYFNPNNSTYAGVMMNNRLILDNFAASGVIISDSSMFLGHGTVLGAMKATFCTDTSYKSWIAQSALDSASANHVAVSGGSWFDSTTVWSSLGTIISTVNLKGKVYVRRIA